MKRRISHSRVIFSLGTDPSPLAQDDRLVEDYLRHKVFLPLLNGEISVSPMNGAEEAELAVIVEVAE